MMRVLTVVIALAVPAAALAQAPAGDRELSDVRANARGHVGPFYVTPGVLLKELGVDNNVFNAAGEPESDFTFTLQPSLKIWMPMSNRAMLKGTVTPDLVWYAEHSTERSINPHLTARGEVYLGRVTLFGERGYLSTRQRPNYELDLRSRHVQDSTQAGLGLAVTSRLSMEVAGREVDLRYDSDAAFEGATIASTLNRRTRGVQLTARHRVTPLTTVALRADVLEDRFSFSPGRNSESYRIMPGVEFAPQALIKGTAHVGFRRFTPVSPDTLPAFSGVVADLGLSYTLLGSTVLGASYRRDLTYSYSEVQPFFVDNAVGVSVRRALGRRFDVIVSGDRHDYDYRNAPNVELLDERRDTTWTYAGSIGYRLGREGRIGFGISHVERQSTNTARAYSNLRFGTTVGYGF